MFLIFYICTFTLFFVCIMYMEVTSTTIRLFEQTADNIYASVIFVLYCIARNFRGIKFSLFSRISQAPRKF